MEQRAKNIVFERLMKLIEKYQDKEWEWEYISSNINLTIEMIENYGNFLNWNYISSNDYLTMEIIDAYPDKDWDWESISQNHNITTEFVQKYCDKPWNWQYISENSFNIEYEIILKNKNIHNELIARTLHIDRSI